MEGLFMLFVLLLVVVGIISVAVYSIAWLRAPWIVKTIVGTVKEVDYSPARSTSGAGVGTNGGVAITSHSTSEVYAVVFTLEGGGVFVAEDGELYEQAATGEKYYLHFEYKIVGKEITSRTLLSWKKIL